ncbi:MAG: hypothetical protein K2V38_23960 [Gemmataceae bacterium]|nr:hypothetical protein [Gemmataceae bacterium]
MIQTTIERTDPHGQAVAVPAEVLAAIEPAQRFLMERLKPAEHLPARVVWRGFEDRGADGWTVELHTEYEGLGADQRLSMSQLRTPPQMREQMLEATWNFAGLLSSRLKSNLSQIRADLARLAAEPKE